MSKFLASFAVATAATLACLPAMSAESFLDFTIDETSVPGANALGFANSALVADKFNGGFTEYLTFTTPNTFSAQAYANFGQYFKNEGTTLVGSLLNSFEGIGGYGVYALFNAAGNVSGLNFTGTSAAFYLYIDPNQDTTFAGTDGVTAIGTANTGDDYLIASSTVLSGTGVGTLTAAPGAYNFDFKDFTLTSGDQNGSTVGTQNGELFFVQPRPFHFLVRVNGDNDIATDISVGTIRVTGDVSAVFSVPEPGSLALVGTLLAGLGFVGRRRR